MNRRPVVQGVVVLWVSLGFPSGFIHSTGVAGVPALPRVCWSVGSGSPSAPVLVRIGQLISENSSSFVGCGAGATGR